jgi:hypothetical protein
MKVNKNKIMKKTQMLHNKKKIKTKVDKNHKDNKHSKMKKKFKRFINSKTFGFLQKKVRFQNIRLPM